MNTTNNTHCVAYHRVKLVRERAIEYKSVAGFAGMVNIAKKLVGDCPSESMLVLALSAKLDVTGTFISTNGTIDSSLVDYPGIIRYALLSREEQVFSRAELALDPKLEQQVSYILNRDFGKGKTMNKHKELGKI